MASGLLGALHGVLRLQSRRLHLPVPDRANLVAGQWSCTLPYVGPWSRWLLDNAARRRHCGIQVVPHGSIALNHPWAKSLCSAGCKAIASHEMLARCEVKWCRLHMLR